MPHYMLAVHGGPPPPDAPPPTPPSEQDVARHMAAIDELEAAMHDQGAWVYSVRLHAADTATVVRGGDQPSMTDGPYLESKEHVAGFYVVAADDLDDALAWGTRVSTTVGMPIEVRPIADWKA